MRPLLLSLPAMMAFGAWALQASPVASDALSRFAPADVFDQAKRARIDAGQPVVDVLPAEGRDVAVFGTVRTDADGDRLVAWMRRIEDFQQGAYVPTVARFSNPPQARDLEALVLGRGDLEDIKRCRPGSCGVRLSAEEIARLQLVIGEAGSGWQAAVQREFRGLMLERASAYLRGGHAATPAFRDRKTPQLAGVEFQAITSRIGFDALSGPFLACDQQDRPGCGEAESFLYWSHEYLGVGKPIVSITHVNIFRSGAPGGPDALIASKQVFASHYFTASLSLTAIVDGPADTRYLLYVRRSRADVLEGAFGGLMRKMVEGRIRSEAPAALERFKVRLESGLPVQK